MSTKSCPVGEKWDYLLVECVKSSPLPPPPPPTIMSHGVVPVPLRTPVPEVWTDPTVSPILLAVVALVVASSVLALGLLTLIYRQRRNHSNRLPLHAREPMDKTDPLAGVHKPLVPGSYPLESLQKDLGHPCPHLDGGTRTTDFRHVNGITSCGRVPGLTWVGESGATGRKPCIPLPATDLGDTTLVTAKTCRDH